MSKPSQIKHSEDNKNINKNQKSFLLIILILILINFVSLSEISE